MSILIWKKYQKPIKQEVDKMAFVRVERENLPILKFELPSLEMKRFKQPEGLLDNLILPLREQELDKDIRHAYFIERQNLKEYREVKFDDNELFLTVMSNIIKLFEETENKRYKFFCFDMKSLYFDENLTPYIYLYYPLFTEDDQYDMSKFEMPIYINTKPLTFRSNNSRIIAEIFGNLKYRDEYRNQNNPREKKEFVREKLRLENLHDFIPWFEKSYENKYDIKTLSKKFEHAIQNYQQRKRKESKSIKGYKASGESFYGSEKLKPEDDFKPDEEVNQDSYLLKKINEETIVAAVMDGVSTAKIGNGNIASNTAKKILEEEIQELSKQSNTEINEENVKNFFENFLKKANEAIINKALEISENAKSDEIMSTTFTGVIVHKDKVYICSVGDSPAILLNDENAIILNIEHNVAFERRINKRMINGDPESLTQVIGKAKMENDRLAPADIEYQFIATKILEGETLILCSDGVIDYCMGNREEEKIDDFVNKYREAYEKSNGKIKPIPQIVLSKIDENKAGDNITMVIIKPEFNNQEGQ